MHLRNLGFEPKFFHSKFYNKIMSFNIAEKNLILNILFDISIISPQIFYHLTSQDWKMDDVLCLNRCALFILSYGLINNRRFRTNWPCKAVAKKYGW